jgi:ABC-type amino acid transport substrate-binding protein
MSDRSHIAVAFATAALVLSGCRAATPTPAPEGPATSTGERGVLVVATTANYAPFEYYDDALELTGFDIDLMRSIAAQLGKPVQFEDHAFDGLIGEVELGQVDAAIAALSVTPGRLGRVAFSDVYYVGMDAVLGPEGLGAPTIAAADDLADLTVGVEHGSVYEEWLRKELVDTGRMPSSQLLVYGSAAQAVADLRAQRIQAVLLDRDAADQFVAQGGVSLLASGIHPQRLAIAVAKGNDELRLAINGALATLSQSGEIGQLAAAYGLVSAQDTGEIPAEAETPAPEPACIDGMRLEQSLTLDDHNLTAPPVVEPGEILRKAWRVSNTGTCTWDDRYTVVYSSGNVPAAEMGGEPVSVQGTVDPGGSYDVSVELVAPLEPGIYQALWEMRNAELGAFGERLVVAVQVAQRPTATPEPTQTPVPDIQFAADVTTIAPGDKVVFSWSAPAAQAVYFFAEGRDWGQFPVANVGQRAAYPEATMSYFLRVQQPTGAIEQRQIHVEVVPPANAPRVSYLSVLPEQNLAVGQCAAIQWAVEGDVTKVVVSANGTAIWDGAPFSGYMPHCPAGAGTVDYAVEATGPGGSSRAQYELDVVSSGGNAGPAPTGPVITAFSVTPDRLPAGSCVRIYWKVSGSFERVQVYRGTRVVLDNAPPSADTEDCSYDAGTIVYSVKAIDAQGRVATREATATFE